MNDHEYEKLDGLDLAALLRAGEVSSEDLMRCAVRLAQQRAPTLNALSYERYEESLLLARNWKPRGTFGGIPFLLKDSGLASVRLPSSIGSRLFGDTRFARNATLTDRFEAAGLIPFARSNVPELCMAPTTEATRNGGPTFNPWDRSRSAGGSSGGAAVAVTAGLVPVAHGSEGGGAIRIPASGCGLFGHKVSRGMVPMGPMRGEGWGGLAVDGVLSRTVRDTAAVLDAIAGAEPGAPYAGPVFARPFLSCVDPAGWKPQRIGVWRQPFGGIELAPECLAAVDATARLCESLGHEVVEAAPPDFEYDAFVDAHSDVLAANIVLSVNARLQVLGRELRDDDLEPAIRDGYDFGQSVPAARYAAAINRFHAVGRMMDACMAGVDVLITPTLVQLPAVIGELAMTGSFQEFRRRVSRYSTFLAVINASGQPAASLPTHWTASGLPVGTQVIARFGHDDTVLRLAAQIEASGLWQPKEQRYGQQ